MTAIGRRQRSSWLLVCLAFRRQTIGEAVQQRPRGPFIIAAIYSGLGYAAVFLSVAGAYLLLMELYVVLGPADDGPLAGIRQSRRNAGRRSAIGWGAPADCFYRND